MITLISTVIENVNYAITFKNVAYQVRRTGVVVFESSVYEAAREFFLKETGV